MSELAGSSGTEGHAEYLQNLHEKFNTPPELIAAAVKKASGYDLLDKKRIIAGERNEVYDAATAGGPDVIVRISREGLEGFEREEEVIRTVRMFGVPAPKVLLIEKPEKGGTAPVFCVEEKIEGDSWLSILNQTEPESLQAICQEAGEILSDIHSITADRYGDLDTRWPINSWSGYILGLRIFKGGILKGAKAAGISRTAVDRAFEIMWKNRELFKIDKPSLLHGDFTPKNILIKEGEISGVLDFQEAKGGDPVFDFAWLDFFYGDKIPMDSVKEGYANKELFNEQFDSKLKVYRLVIASGLMNYYQSRGDKGGLNFAAKKLTAELAGFEVPK